MDDQTLVINQITDEVIGADQMGPIYRARTLLWNIATREYKEIFSGSAHCVTPEWIQLSTPSRPRGAQRYFEGPPRGPYTEYTKEVFDATRNDNDCRRKRSEAPELIQEKVVARLREGFGYIDFGPQPKAGYLKAHQPGDVIQVRQPDGSIKEVSIFPEWVRPDGGRYVVDKINSRWTVNYIRFLDAYLVHGQLGGRTGQVPTSPPYYYLLHRDGRIEEKQGPEAPWYNSRVSGFEPRMAMTKRGAYWSPSTTRDREYGYLQEGNEVKRSDIGTNISPNGCMSAGMILANPADAGRYGFIRRGALSRPIVSTICQ